MGRNTAATAASALRLLTSEDLRHQPTPTPQQRRATPHTPGTPLNVALVDYLTEHIDEIITHTRSAAGPQVHVPLPAATENIYDWYIHHTRSADQDQARFRDTLIERHALEHAIALGEHNAVRPHPCPRCGGWSLFWDAPGARARCTDTGCRTPDGLASSWTLARLAAQKIQRTEIWRRNAT